MLEMLIVIAVVALAVSLLTRSISREMADKKSSCVCRDQCPIPDKCSNRPTELKTK
jgi:hypothetical protein